MSDIDHVRCSSLPEAERCPGSIRAPALRIEVEHEASAEGTAVHELMRPVVDSGVTNANDLDIVGTAARHGVNADNLRRLVWYGIKAWKELQPSFAGALSEVPLEHRFKRTKYADTALTGHLDLLTIAPPIARFIDWKSGRVDRDYSPQMGGYAALVLLNHPEIKEVTGSVVWLREQEIETYTMRAEDLAPWIERFVGKILMWDGVYHPGRHCSHCRRSHDCEALAACARRDLAVLGAPDLAAKVKAGLVDVPAADVVALYRKAKMLESFARTFTEAVRARVSNEGELDAGDGTKLTIAEENRREIDTLAAWPTLSSLLSDDELAACLDVRIGEVEKTVAKNAGRGNGVKAKEKLAADLEAAGAVKLVTVRKLKETRK